MADVQTKQQKRAKYALEELTKNTNSVDKELSKLLISLPNLILSNGINQTFAFLLAKTKRDKDTNKIIESDKHYIAFILMKEWLIQEKFMTKENNLEFLKEFNDFSSKKYVDVQNECLKLDEWLKRYARAFETETK